MRPSFVVIGTMKGGTTSLRAYLRRHPRLFVPKDEINFFSLNWERGLAWYESLFSSAPPGAILAEVSPSYTTWPGPAAERLARTMPDIRMVYCVRDPIERARAHYFQLVAAGMETRSFEQAVVETPWYVTCSRYAFWIEHYLEYFDRSQLLLLTTEGLRQHRGEALDRILEFVGLPAGWRPPNVEHEFNRRDRKVEPRAWARPLWRNRRLRDRMRRSRRARAYLARPLDYGRGTLSPEADGRLRDVLRPDVEKLGAYMGPGFDGWGFLEH